MKIANRSALSLLLTISSGLLFGYWLKNRQLTLLSLELPSVYPWSWWIQALLLSVLLFLISQQLGRLLVQSLAKKTAASFLIQDALCHFILCLPLLEIPFRIAFFLFLTARLTLLLLQARGAIVEKLKQNRVHCLSLCLIALAILCFNDFLSPRSWLDPLSAINKSESQYLWNTLATYDSDILPSKASDFSGFNPVAFGGLPHTVGSSSSLLLQGITIALDIAVIDKESFLSLSLCLIYLLNVAGSFGFYLLLLQAAKLQPPICLLGGILFTLSNPFYSELLTYHFPYFVTPFLLLPFAFLMLHHAFQKKSYVHAFMAGLILSLQGIIWSPHPDSTLHATFALFLFSLYLRTKQPMQIRNTIALIVLPLAAMGLGSLVVYGPGLESALRHEQRVVGHLLDEKFIYGWKDGILWNLLPIFRNYFPLFALLALSRKKVNAWILGLLLFFLLGIVPGIDGPLEFLLNRYQVPILNFRMQSRVVVYISTTLLFLILMGLERLLTLGEKPFFKAVYATLSLVAVGISFKKITDLPTLLIPTIFFIVSALLSAKYIFKITPASRLTYSCFCLASLLSLLTESSAGLRSGLGLITTDSKCQERVQLSSLLAMNRFNRFDSDAAERLVRKRLRVIYQKDRSLLKSALEKRRLTSLQELSKEELFALAEEVAPAVDKSLSSACFTDPPLHDINVESLANRITPGLHRTGCAFLGGGTTGSGTGLGTALKTVNMNQVFDQRFVYVYPPINPLYLSRGHFFEHIGEQYFSRSFDCDNSAYLDPMKRHSNAIAGIDYYLIDSIDEKKATELSGITLIEKGPTGKSPSLIQDTNSYGFAYLARTLYYVDKKHNQLMDLMPPWIGKNAENLPRYKEQTEILREDLLKLKEKHSAIIETDVLNLVGKSEAGSEKNHFTLGNAVGARASFKVHCDILPCRLVMNNAALSGWRGFIGTLSVPVERANYAFLSIQVPLGDHLVWFEYRTLTMASCALITLTTWLIGLFITLSKRRVR